MKLTDPQVATVAALEREHGMACVLPARFVFGPEWQDGCYDDDLAVDIGADVLAIVDARGRVLERA